jgi:hypothetical protein
VREYSNVRAAESTGEFEGSGNIQTAEEKSSSEREYSRGLDAGKAEAHKEKKRKNGALRQLQNATSIP